MKCTRVEKLLPLYVAGDLAGRPASRRIANHLTTCESCRGLAAEYDASRDLVRDAATLPPDFDGAFYEELRRSVLAEIERERPRFVPPTRRRFASLFNARFAYAASLAFLIAAVAALSLYSYPGQKKSEDAAGSNLLADANHAGSARPAETPAPASTQAKDVGRQTVSPADASAGEHQSRGEQRAAKSPSPKRRANDGNRRTETQPGVDTSKHTASHARRNPLAPSIAATGERVEESARSSNSSSRSSGGDGATDAAPEVSRIEIQTSDPNIRIIWLSPKPEPAEQPLN
ncbi:MAG: hypothetical protein QOD32_3283 [Pyrinomonadaceae bacterium]|jgi:hypothetical protein|nr:hypothetical protein [Pyrinomonadaceae bacterium]